MKSEVKIQAGPANVNIRRLFESQPVSNIPKSNESKEIPINREEVKTFGNFRPKRDEKHCRKETHNKVEKSVKSIEPLPEEDCDRDSCHRIFSADSHRVSRKERLKAENIDKTNKNNNKENQHSTDKPKGFIRPRSSSQIKIPKSRKKTDPVALYQSYQKDWTKFRSNICESSHSDLRWSIREKLMNSR